jgi:hypothetical protein
VIADDNVQELIQIIVKAGRLGFDEVMKSVRWYADNKKDEEKFVENNGLVDMKTLHESASSVKFLPNEIDQEEIKMISREFQRYNILFAVDKQENGNYVLAFAGKNEESIEYAMKQVIRRQDRKLRKAKEEERKPTVEKINRRWQEYMTGEDRENKTKDKSKEQQKSQEDRSL